MKNENIFCLVVADDNFSALNLLNIKDAPKELEVDLKNKKWRLLSSWREIGESGSGHVRLVFDWTNFEHFKKALEVTANFHR